MLGGGWNCRRWGLEELVTGGVYSEGCVGTLAAFSPSSSQQEWWEQLWSIMSFPCSTCLPLHLASPHPSFPIHPTSPSALFPTPSCSLLLLFSLPHPPWCSSSPQAQSNKAKGPWADTSEITGQNQLFLLHMIYLKYLAPVIDRGHTAQIWAVSRVRQPFSFTTSVKEAARLSEFRICYFIHTHSFNKYLQQDAEHTKAYKMGKICIYSQAHSFWKLPVLSPRSSSPSEIYYPVFTLEFLSKVSSKCSQNEQVSLWHSHRALFIFLLGIRSTLKWYIYSHVHIWMDLYMCMSTHAYLLPYYKFS